MSLTFVVCTPADFAEPASVNRPGIPCYSSGDFLNLTPKLMEKMFKDLRAGTILHHHLFEKLAMDLGRIIQCDSSRGVVDLTQESREKSDNNLERGTHGLSSRDAIDLTQESSEDSSEELQHGYPRLSTSDFLDLAPESTEKSGEDLEFGSQHYMSSDFAKWSGGG